MREKHPLPTEEESLSKLAVGVILANWMQIAGFGKSIWLQNQDFLPRLSRHLVGFVLTDCLWVFPLQVSTLKKKCHFC